MQDPVTSLLPSEKAPLSLLEFRASWCPVCDEQSRIVERIARKYWGSLSLQRLEIEGNVALAVEMGIQAVPTLVLCLRGREVRRFIGFQEEESLHQAVRAHLEPSFE